VASAADTRIRACVLHRADRNADRPDHRRRYRSISRSEQGRRSGKAMIEEIVVAVMQRIPADAMRRIDTPDSGEMPFFDNGDRFDATLGR
jgi:hypothetical protein